MHRFDNLKIIHDPQANMIYTFKNANQKLLKTNAKIWVNKINKICRINQSAPKYV
jgi:hypothetical protein